jgi:thiol-disulfide isomerase/thioredoxin
MSEEIDRDRRRILGGVAMMVAVGGLGIVGPVVRRGTAAPLPSLASATAWLNSPPLTAAGLRGRVVLIDFWTYTCINWLRTLPYVRAWAERYKDQGLVVIGVHAPEFAFDAGGAEAAADWASLKSPENYVGYERTANFASPGGASIG